MNKMEKVPPETSVRMTSKQLKRLLNKALNSNDRDSYMASADYTFRSIGRPADADVLQYIEKLLKKNEIEIAMFFISKMPI